MIGNVRMTLQISAVSGLASRTRKRTLLRVVVVDDERKTTDRSVERLMGNKPEARFEFIQERAEFAADELLDV